MSAILALRRAENRAVVYDGAPQSTPRRSLKIGTQSIIAPCSILASRLTRGAVGVLGLQPIARRHVRSSFAFGGLVLIDSAPGLGGLFIAFAPFLAL
jgi:hypothetical protein